MAREFSFDINANDGASGVVDQLIAKFGELDERARKAGKEINESVFDEIEGMRELAASYDAQAKLVRNLDGQYASLVARKRELQAKGNAISKDETKELFKINRELQTLIDSTEEENSALSELQSTFDESSRRCIKGLNDIEKVLDKVKDKSKVTEEIDDDSDAMEALGNIAGKVGKAMGIAFTVDKAIEFGQKVVQVRGEMQALNASFTTMLGSKEKADELLKQSIEFASHTPFDLQSVASSAKQLLAYGTEQSKVIEDMEMMGNVASGLAIPIKDLIYLYGTLRAQGRVMTIDIRQFAMRGIPIYEELAKVMGVTKDKVGELVTAGKVQFEQVEQAFKNMTSEGGKFEGLIGNMSKTVGGKISNIGDDIYQMFNEIGEKLDGVINKGLEATSWLVGHYKEIAKVLWECVKAYGAYKAAVIAVNAAQALSAGTLSALNIATITAIAKTKLLTKANDLLNKTMLKNPYVLVLMGMYGLIDGVMKLTDKLNSGAVAQDKYNKYVEKQKEVLEKEKGEMEKLIALYSKTEEGSKMRLAAVNEITKAYPELLDKYRLEQIALMDIKQLMEEINGIQADRIFNQDISTLENLVSQIETLKKTTNFAGGPYGAIDNAANKVAIDELQKMIDALQQKLYTENFDKMGFNGPQKPTVSAPTEEKVTVKDKKYWEDEKKSAQAALDALTVEQLATKEGIEAKKRLKEAEDALEKYSNKNKKNTEAEKKAKEIAKAAKEAIEAEKKLNDELRKAEEQRVLDSKEGLEKELVQIAINSRRRVSELEKAKEELEKKFKAANDGKTLTDEQKNKLGFYDSLISAEKDSVDTKRIDAIRKSADEVAKANQSLRDKELEIDRAYQKDKKALEEAYEKTGDERYKRALREREKAYKSSLYELKTENSEAYRAIFRDIDSMTDEMVSNAISLAEAEMERLISDGSVAADVLASLRNRISEMKAAQLDRQFGGWGGNIVSVMQRGAKMDALKDQEADLRAQYTAASQSRGRVGTYDEEESQKKLMELSVALHECEGAQKKLNEEQKKELAMLAGDKIGKGLSKIGDSLREVAEASGDNSLLGLSNTLSEIGDAVSNVVQGFANGGLVGGITAIAGTVFNKVVDFFTSSAVAAAKSKKASEDYRKELALLALQLHEDDYSNIFGSDKVSFVADAWNKANEALKLYKDQEKLVLAHLTMGFTGELGDKLKESWIQAGVLNEDGSLNVENTEAYLAARDSKDEDFEYLKQLKEAYEKAIDAVKSFVGELTGASATDIASEMVDTFLETGSAIADMTSNLDNFKTRLAKTIVESMLLKKVFTTQRQDEIAEMLANGKTTDAINAYNALLTEANEMTPSIQSFLESMNLNMKAANEATAGGYATMTQDQASELNGRFTALQISGEDIRDSMAHIAEQFDAFALQYKADSLVVDDIRNIQAQALLELIAINENTAAIVKPIKDMSDSVGEIKQKVDRL